MRIVLTGPESSGKSTLCRDLSHYYKGSMIPEYARNYLEAKTTPEYTIEEVIFIAHKQYLNSKNQSIKNIQFEDTDLLNIIVWLELKYDRIDEQIVKLFKNHKANFYLLCQPDLSWHYDPIRESEWDLDRIYHKHLFYLQKYKLEYRIISGYARQRTNNAIFHVQDMLLRSNFAR